MANDSIKCYNRPKASIQIEIPRLIFLVLILLPFFLDAHFPVGALFLKVLISFLLLGSKISLECLLKTTVTTVVYVFKC
jgi:hypothetical protein